MAVYDCFTFFNELDILEVRLHQMAPYVDHFVLVEAPLTHRGQPKPLLFRDNIERFSGFIDRIRHIVVDDMPRSDDHWQRERYQRTCLLRGLHDASPLDTILVSDVDEIARESAVQAAVARGTFCYLTQDLFYFYMNWRATLVNQHLWTKAYAAPFRFVRQMPNISAPREQDIFDFLAGQGLNPVHGIIDCAGWHFSWTGGPDRLVTKMNSFAHDEFAMQQWNDPAKLAQAISDQRFFYAGESLENLAVGQGFPEYLCQQQQRYRTLGLVSPNSDQGVLFHEVPRAVVAMEVLELKARLTVQQSETAAALARLADAQAIVERCRCERDRHQATAEQARQALEHEHGLAERRGQELEALRASTFWRLTSPARKAADLAKRMRVLP